MKLKDYNWEQCEDFLNIKRQVEGNVSYDLPILPLKYSNGFDTVDDEELSIIQMTEQRKIWNYYYRTEASHINKLYKLMKSYE